MIHRLWHEGYLTVEKGRPLDTVRKVVLSRAKQFDCDVLALPDVEHADPDRLDLALRWIDEDIPVAAMLALRRSAINPSHVDWLLTAASPKPWRLTFIPPSTVLGLDDDLDAQDRAGGRLHSPRVIRCMNLGAKLTGELVDLVGGWINDPERSVGLIVFPDRCYPRYVGSVGLAMAIAVDEVGRMALNGRLQTRPIPQGQARLFMPAVDELPDATSPMIDYKVAAEMRTALHQLLHIRQRTPLPERWRDDPQLQAWWAMDPLAIQETAPVEETNVADVHIEQQLREARQQINILKRQKKTAEDALEATEAQNTLLQQQLTQHVDHGDLEPQLAALQELVDDYAATLEDVEAERDALRRKNGLLIVQLAQADTSTTSTDEQEEREFASFAELLHAASTELPGLVVTADPAPATALDHHPKAPAWRRKTWDALLTLHAYVTARTNGSASSATHADVRTFARAGQPGSLISANIIKLNESDSVMNQPPFYQARIFPVRTETDPSGRAFFGAHIALERFKTPAPRLHFLDDVARNGVLYVGYLGEHLPNTKTN